MTELCYFLALFFIMRLLYTVLLIRTSFSYLYKADLDILVFLDI